MTWGDSAKMWISWRHRKPTEYIWCWLATPQAPSKLMLWDLVACSSSNNDTECVQWNPRSAYTIAPQTPAYIWYPSKLLPQASSTYSFTGYSWRWGRPENETIVMWDVCKWDKVVLWNTKATVNEIHVSGQKITLQLVRAGGIHYSLWWHHCL